MSAIAKKPRQNQPGKPTLVSYKQKGKKSRNWTAGVIASAIAVAWAVGGLVMPSLAATPNAQASVHPTVNVSSKANVGLEKDKSKRYVLAYTGNLFSTQDPQVAAAHYGETAQVGDFTAHYLPKECISRATGVSGGSKQPYWGGFDALDQVAPDRGPIAKKALKNDLQMGFGAWVIFPGSSTTLRFNASGSSAQASGSNRSAISAADSEEDADTFTLSLEPIEGEAEAVEPSAPVETGATQARIFAKTTEPSADSDTSTESTGSADAPQLPASPEESVEPSTQATGDPSTEPSAPGAGQDREANPTPAQKVMPRAVPFAYKFEPTQRELKLKFDPSVDKDTAIADFNKQVDEYQADVLNQLDQFVIEHNIDAGTKALMVQNLNAQFDNLRKQGLAWFEEQYSKTPSVSKFPGIKACEENGPIVPNGSFVLVKDWTADKKNGEPNVWKWAKKFFDGVSTKLNPSIGFVSIYPSDKEASFTVDGKASFCVEPFYGISGGDANVYTDPSKSTIYWAKQHPEKAETIKALAWHFTQNGKQHWGKYQNAIWMVIFGITENGRAWDSETKQWGDTSITDVTTLIQQAKTAYENRPDGNVVKALETMHLDQESLEQAPDGSYLLRVKLNDYDPNSIEGRTIGNQVYLTVNNATYADGTPIPGNQISLAEAVNGVTLKVTDQSTFSIGFAGKLEKVEDPYFIDDPTKDTQGQVVVAEMNLDVSGNLEVKWNSVPQPKPSISTTAKVNNADSVPNGAETATITGPNDQIVLTDDVKYVNIPANVGTNNKYLVATLKKVSGNTTTTVFTKTEDFTATGSGTVTGLFPYTINPSEVKDGDRFYYEEILATSDPTYASGGKVMTAYGELNIMAKHVGENPDQTVNIQKSKAQLTLTKAASGATDKADGNVAFHVTCDDGTDQKLYAPARGGVANTDATLAGKQATTLEVTPGAICTIEETYASAPVNLSNFGWSAQNATAAGNVENVVEGGRVIGSKAKFVMGDNGAINVTVTNGYSEKTGGFKVVKQVETDGTLDANAAAAANGGKFQFTYTCDNGVSAGSFALPEDPATDTDSDPWTYEVKGLPVGTKCKVTETQPVAPQGYDVVVSTTNASGVTSPVSTIAVKPIQENFIDSVGFTNKYLPSDAAFSLQKVAKYANGGQESIDANFTLHYECSGKSGTASGDVVVAGNGSAVSVTKGIKAGMTCTISEPKPTKVDGANFKSVEFSQIGIPADNVESNTADGLKFKVPANKAAVVVTATNVYEHKMGSFTLTKKVKADGANPLKDTAFTFRVSCGEDDVTLTLKDGATWKSDSYLAGTECLIHEDNPSTAAATNKVTYEGATAMGETDAVLTIKEGTEPAVKVVATNTVKANYGKFSVTKTVEGDAKASADTFAFDYKCADAAQTHGTLDVKAGETKTVDENILVGTTCYIKEKPVKIDGVTVTPSWVTNLANATGANAGYKQFTIPELQGGKAQVLQLEAKNKLEYDKANFTIKKVVQGGAIFEPGADFKFTYNCKAPNGKVYTQATPFGAQAKADFITVAAGQESAPIVVPKDSVCSVAEPKDQLEATNKQLVNNPNANPLKYVSTSFVPAGKGLASGEQTITEGATFQFAATNVYTEKMTGFMFYKDAVTGNNAGNHTEQFNFNYSCQTPSGVVKNGVGYDLRAGSDPVKVENLPVGTKCVVWEKPAVAIANEKSTTKWTVGNAAAVDGKEVKPFDSAAGVKANGVAFTVDQEGTALMVGATNDFTVPDTKLVVSKTIVAGENTNVTGKVVKLSATCKYPTDGAEHVIMKDKTFKHNDSAEFSADVNGVKIPVGATCTISESADSAKVAGHIWKVQMKEGKNVVSNEASTELTLDTEKGRTIEVVNTYERELGKFKITKQVQAAKNIKVKKSYNFTYTCADPDDATQKVEGKVTEVSDGGTKIVEGIPVGYKCHITEDEAGAQTAEGSTLTANLSKNDFVVDKDNVVEVTVNNVYSKANGRFTVTKAIAKDSTAALTDGEYNFEYWCTIPGEDKGIGSQEKPNEFKIKAGETWTSDDIPSGSQCYIREVAPSGTTTGVVAEVSWSLAEDTAIQGVPATDFTPVDKGFVFGAEGATAGKFTIGKDGSVTNLTATNKLTYKQVKLTLQKVAEATSAHGQLDYSVENFNAKQGYNQYYRYMNRDFVNMHVTCKSGEDTVLDKTVEVKVNGDLLDFGTVPYNTKCTVAELDDESFNDVNALQYGGWRHKAEITATADGKDIAAKVDYAFDMLNPDHEGAAITFPVKKETGIAVKMLNRWDCYASIESTLDAPDNVVLDAQGTRVVKNGIKVVEVKDGQQRVKLTDTVTLKNVTPGHTYSIVERLYSTDKAGDQNRFDKGYLTWKSESGANWDYYTEEVRVPAGKTDFTVEISFTIPAQLIKDHPEGIAAGIMVFNGGGNPMANPGCSQCRAYGSELKLPAGQSIIPQWTAEMKTSAKTENDQKLLAVGDKATNTITDTVWVKNAKAEDGVDYELYGRVVLTTDHSQVVGEGRADANDLTKGDFNEWVEGKNGNIVINQEALQKAAASVKTGDPVFLVQQYLVPKGTPVDQVEAKAIAKHDADVICQRLFAPSVNTNATVGKAGGTQAVGPEATGTVKIVDKVAYKNLNGGAKYTVTGTLRYQADANLADGTKVTKGDVVPGVTVKPVYVDLTGEPKDKTFSGSVDVTFEVPATSLAGQAVVVFEDLKNGDVVVATHSDIDDEAQTIYSPKLGTTLVDSADSDKFVAAGANAKVTDTVTYSGLDATKTYVLVGKLHNVVDGKAKGIVDTQTKEVQPGKDPWTMEFTFKAEAGTDYVAFEYLYEKADYQANGDKATVIAKHEDPQDDAQTVYTPKVTTDAYNGAGKPGDKFVDVTKDFTISDKVTASGLIPGKEYTVTGELKIKDGSAEGKSTGIAQEGKFTAKDDGTGEIVLTFTVSAQQAADLGLIGKPIVAFEDLKHEGKTIAVHHDINDGDQTVYNGSMGTSAVDKSDENQTMTPGQKDATIVDTVKFTGKFEPKHKYTLVGELHYVTTDASGAKTLGEKVPGVTVAPKPVTAGTDGTIADQKMEFKVPADSIEAGKSMVVIEKLFDGEATTGTPVITHEDPKDAAQTITVNPVEITTTAYDGASKDEQDKNLEAAADGSVTIYDLVDYKGLEVGKEYTISGTLYYQADATLADGTQVKKGDPIDPKYVTTEPVTFKANKANSDEEDAKQVIVKFTVQRAGLATAPVVVFEDLKQGETPLAAHHDINDDNQIVYNPSLETLASVGDKGAKMVQIKKDQGAVTIDDVVTIKNAAAGTYTLKGQLMSADGKTVIASKDVKDVKVAKGETVEKKVSFEVPADQVKPGVKFVVFEELVDAKGDVVADHKDLTSEAQTVTVGSLDTTAEDQADKDHVADNTKDVTIVDKVDYSGLNLDAKYADGTPKAYLLSGQLMDKETKQPVAGLAPVERVIGPANSVYRADGQADRPVEKVITSGTGSELLEFKVPANLILGKPVVVFETVYQDGNEFLIHHDINDDDQTVWAPKLETKARAAGERALVLADAESTVKDTVEFSGMKVGETYVVVGELWNKTQNKSTGIKVTSKPFKAEKAAWTADDFMTFTVPAGTVAENDELVVFETLYLGKVEEGPAESTHQDPDDPAQTVGSGVKPGIKTVLSVDGQRAAGTAVPTIPVDTTQLVDTVSYFGLTKGVSYTLNATLMEISLDGKKVSDTGITGSATFTAPADSGTVEVGYNSFDKGILKPGYKYVAYEQLVRNDKPGEDPVKHEDPKDEDQTVETSYNPSVITDLDQDGSQIIATNAALDLKDKVQMKDLIKGEKYVLVSRLVYNAGQPNETVLASGVERFTAETVDVNKEIKFDVTADQLKAPMAAAKAAGSELKLVAYEYLTRESLVTGNDETIKANVGNITWDATHADPKDARQTVTVVDVPRIGTKLQYKGADVVWEGDNVKLTDYVEYYNLEPGTEYTVNGKLMGIGADGKPAETGVVGTATFTTPKAANGATRVSGTIADGTAAKVEFTVPLSVMKANNKLVAYEALLLKGQPVTDPDGTPVTHEDPKDPNQTVTVKHPGVGTFATVDGDKLKTLKVWKGVNAQGEKAPETYTIQDVIRMVNVEEGKTYALGGQVYSQAAWTAGDHSALATNAKTVKVSADMAVQPTADEKVKYGDDAKVYKTTMDITVKAKDIATDGDSLVVFEQLWAEGTYEAADGGKVTPKGDHEPVAVHNDITSKSQSITVNRPEFGSLTLTKAVTGWDENTASVERVDAKYLFTVACAAKGSTQEIVLKEGESATIDGIPVGDTCTITEDVQIAEEQAGLKDTVEYTEANGVIVESVNNGVGTVTVGGSQNGTDSVANVTVVANNKFTHDVAIGTYTIGESGKKTSNGGTITDLVSYKNLQGGKYLLHTYFVEYDKDGKAQKIDYVPSTVREVTVEGGYVKGGHDGTWNITVPVPTELVEEHKTVVLWEDLYRMPKDKDVDAFTAKLVGLQTGQTAPGLIAKHHEENVAHDKGYQWLEVSTHFGGFQVTKVIKAAADMPADVAADIPTTWNFEYTAFLPDNKTAKEGTALNGTFSLTVDRDDPNKAVSPVFDGFPTGTTITITETGTNGNIPTLAKWNATWITNGVTDVVAGTTKTVEISPANTDSVTAVNEFTLVKPTLATVAKTAEGASMLKPSEDTAVVDTVTYTNLVEGREYWLKTELVYKPDASPVLGADGNPLVKWTKVKAETDNSEWVVDRDNPMVVPANANPDADVVFFETLYEMTKDGEQPKANDKPIAEHRNIEDRNQTITRRPTLDLRTTAEVSGASVITPGKAGTVNDTVTYNGLKANGTYTLVGTLVKKSDGSIVGSPVTVTGLKASADGSGSWKMAIPLTAKDTAGLTDGEKLVVFEKVYDGNLADAGKATPGTYTPVKTHEDINDVSQTVIVVKPTTPPPPHTPGTPGTPYTPGTPPSTPSTPPVKSESTTPPPSTPSNPPSIPVAPATTLPPAHPKIPPTLARTGAQAAVFGGLSILMIAAGAGIGLLAARRKRQSAE